MSFVTLTVEQQKLVNDNEKLVYYLITHKCNVEQRDFEDVCQLGMMALCKAAATFDSSLNRKFSTYAASCILNEVKMFYRKENRVRAKCISIDEPLTNESDESSKGKNTIATLFADPNNHIDDLITREENERKINMILNRLSIKESTLALLYLGELNQYDIGRMYFDLSQSYISRLISGITKKLRGFENVGVENVAGRYDFSILDDLHYRVRIFGVENLSQEIFDEIREVVRSTKSGKRRIVKNSNLIEIVMVRDSSFFEMLAKINLILYKDEFSSWVQK